MPTLTEDQNRRLDAAIDNISQLMGENEGELVEWLIDLLTGKADQLKEESMGRPKKNVVAPTAAPAPISSLTPEAKDALILAWKTAKDALDKAKADEAALRMSLVMSFFDPTKLEGTDTADIGYGYGLRITRELAYNATNKEHETEVMLGILGATNPELATTLIRWQPDVAKAVYRKVVPIAEANPELKAAMVKAITIKPGMPQLEMVPPKVEDAPVPVLEMGFVPE